MCDNIYIFFFIPLDLCLNNLMAETTQIVTRFHPGDSKNVAPVYRSRRVYSV